MNVFKSEIVQMRKMFGIESLMSKMPGQIGEMSKHVPEGTAERAMGQVEAIINSMTAKERANPALIKASRKRRIAQGAGLPVQEVNKVLKQYEQMRDVMKKFHGGGMGKMMKMMGGMRGLKNMMGGKGGGGMPF